MFLTNKTALRNQKGELIGILGVSTDITEHKQRSEQLAKAKIELAQLKGISLLGAMLAYELKKPLAAVKIAIDAIFKVLPALLKGYTQWSKEADKPIMTEHKLNQFMESEQQINQSLSYIHAIIDAVLAHSCSSQDRAASQEYVEQASINQIVSSVVASYPMSNEQRNLVNFMQATPDIEVLINKDILLGVLYNLHRHSFYAIKQAGKGDISITVERNDKFVNLYFTDTATGIPENDINNISQPFYTNKMKSASGIGSELYFCKLNIEKFGGDMSCHSVPGEFAKFCLKVPMVQIN